MVTKNQIDGPIPGQSLTNAPGGAKWEKAPAFSEPAEAAEYSYKQLTTPRMALMVKTMLEEGIPAEVITNQILHSGFVGGKWTVDTAHLMAKPVLAQVLAVGKLTGAKNINIWKPDKNLAKFIASSQGLDDLEAQDRLNESVGSLATGESGSLVSDEDVSELLAEDRLQSSPEPLPEDAAMNFEGSPEIEVDITGIEELTNEEMETLEARIPGGSEGIQEEALESILRTPTPRKKPKGLLGK